MVSVEVSFRDMDRSDELEKLVLQKVEKLQEVYPRIVNCRVIIEQMHNRHRTGNLFHTRVLLGIPGDDIVASRTPPERREYADPYLSVRDTFDTVRRLLLERMDKLQRGYTKPAQPERMLHFGKVAALFPEQAYGFVEAEDGRRVFFHEHSLEGAQFDDLHVGDPVHFEEEEAREGPNASTVRPLEHPNL